jgi:hypothetical protein
MLNGNRIARNLGDTDGQRNCFAFAFVGKPVAIPPFAKLPQARLHLLVETAARCELVRNFAMGRHNRWKLDHQASKQTSPREQWWALIDDFAPHDLEHLHEVGWSDAKPGPCNLQFVAHQLRRLGGFCRASSMPEQRQVIHLVELLLSQTKGLTNTHAHQTCSQNNVHWRAYTDIGGERNGRHHLCKAKWCAHHR